MNMEFIGHVIKKRVGIGTKSEHEAILLATDTEEYLLRRLGGNPFRDPQLEALVGQRIRAEGHVHGQTLIVSAWGSCPDG